MKQLILIAGNHSQARNYMREHELGMRDVVFAEGRHRLMGLRDLEYVLVGTWSNRADIAEIRKELLIGRHLEKEHA